MIQDKMVRARRQYHHHHHHNSSNHHRHPLNHFSGRYKRPSVPNAPSNTTQFIMNDHEVIEPDFDLMHNAIMEHYNRSKKRKLQHVAETTATSPKQAATATSTSTSTTTPATTTTATTTTTTTNATSKDNKDHSPLLTPDQIKQEPQLSSCQQSTNSPSSLTSRSNQQQQQLQEQQQQQQQRLQPQLHHPATQLQESTTIKSNPTTPSHRPTGSPGDEDGMSPFVNHEHLQSEFQEVYANIHTERLSSMSKNQLVNQYLLLEERVEELENQLRESQTSASHAG